MADLNILVINSKGGCGKTTVATNLAAAYANRDKRVALFDCDSQASARHWAQCRDDQLSQIDLYYAPEPRLIQSDAGNDYDVCVYDAAPGITRQPTFTADFEALLRQSDVIVVPMLSSAWDIQAGEHFVTQVMTQRVWRAHPRPIAVISNRVNGNPSGQQKLQHFLSCLGVSAIAEFRDSPIYAEAGDNGYGIVEMKLNRAARKEFKAWHQLISWIEESAETQVTARLPNAPLAAPRTTRANRKPENHRRA